MQRQGWHPSFCFTAVLTPGEFITYSDTWIQVDMAYGDVVRSPMIHSHLLSINSAVNM